MEELCEINTQDNHKPFLAPSNFILHTLYTYSSRYIQMP